jgi:hypothetical protein
MEISVISESVITAAAIILVLLGQRHSGMPMGSQKLLEELKHIFAFTNYRPWLSTGLLNLNSK